MGLGQVVTIYGSGLGPREGVVYQPVNNRAPEELAGTCAVPRNGNSAVICFLCRS